MNPRVSICLPVYNGEMHVSATIRSVLAQSFENFELVINDNASTDSTPAICRAFAANDSRIHYARAEVNGGLAWNFNQAFARSRGEYVLWIGHDDLLAPAHISSCVQALESSPQAVVCFPNVNYIDQQGDLIQQVELKNPASSAEVSQRFLEILWDQRCDPVCGLMRAAALKRTGLHGAYADSDRVLLAELGFQGTFLHLPEFLFSRRVHELQATSLFDDRWDRTLVFDPKKAGTAICPWWTEAFDLLAATRKAGLPWRERVRCYRFLYWWYRNYRPYFMQDLRRSGELIARRLSGRPLPPGYRYGASQANGAD